MKAELNHLQDEINKLDLDGRVTNTSNLDSKFRSEIRISIIIA